LPRSPAIAAPAGEVLSARETEILELVAKGMSVREIGALLDVSTHTVGTHVKNIYRKLSVHSRTEAVFEARGMGLLRG
jgi:ATP/maltotriose-dependent transcriptional regulator MalT